MQSLTEFYSPYSLVGAFSPRYFFIRMEMDVMKLGLQLISRMNYIMSFIIRSHATC